MTVETTQPSEETAPATTEATAAVAPEGEQPEGTTPRTPEEVEAYWRNRQSKADSAHAAEAKALRDRLARFEAAEEEKRRAEETARQATMTAEQRMQDQINALTKQLEEKDRNYTVELRKTRFPNVSAELDDAVLAVADEGKLASLEAKLVTGLGGTATPPSLIDKNSVARTGNGTTPPQEQTVEQLIKQLEAEAPAFKAEMESMGVGMRRDT